MDWRSLVDSEKLIEWQRWLHQHPELAFAEVETSRYVYDVLSSFDNLEVTRPTPTSVLAVLKGTYPGIVVGLRADIDALPLAEDADTEYRSLYEGKMHACGHDSHTAMLLGAAHILSQMRDSLSGTVKFIFQHAEEHPPGGALDIIATGVLDDVDCFFANHISPDGETGTVGVISGPKMAAVNNLILKIIGKGSHGAYPHRSIDPITIGCEIVSGLNNIVARNISPFDSAVISVGKFISGSAVNIIPQTAEIEATVRTNTPETRELVEERIRAVVDGICKAYGAEYELEYIEGYMPVVNDAQCISIVERAAMEVLGDGACKVSDRGMGGEDFSAYLEKAPGAMADVYCGFADEAKNYSVHHPKFLINPDVLPVGAKLYAGYALEAMRSFTPN